MKKQLFITAIITVLLTSVLCTACADPMLTPTVDSIPGTDAAALTETDSGTDSESTANPDTDPDTEPETEPETAPPASECRIQSLTVFASDNRNMCAALIGEITDDTVTLTISAPTDTFSLMHAHVTVETDAASVSFSSETEGAVDLTAANAHCTLTDAEFHRI